MTVSRHRRERRSYFGAASLAFCLLGASILGCNATATAGVGATATASPRTVETSAPVASDEEVEATRETAPAILREIDEQLKSRPRDKFLWVRRFQASYASGDLDGALADLDRLGELDGGSKWMRNNRACLRAELGEFREALPDAVFAAHAEPDEPSSWDTLGFVYVGLARYKDALEAYEKALSYKVKPNYLWGKAVALRGLGRDEEAEATFEQALEMQPGYELHWKLDPDPGLRNP